MTKNEFLNRLSEELATLDPIERERMLQYYREIIEDRVEDGLSEDQAVEELEDIHEIAARILEEIGPRPEQASGPAQPEKKRSVFTTVMLILGSPVWLPLLLAGGIVVLAVYVVVWALVISLFAVVAALGIAGLAGLLGFIVHLGTHFWGGLFFFGAGLFCTGAGLALVLPVCAAAKWMIHAAAGFGRWAWDTVFHNNRKERAA